MMTLLIWATLAQTPSAEPRDVTQEAPSILVLNLRSGDELSESSLRVLNDLILSEFQKVDRYRVTGETDLTTMLTVEQQKQLMGCEADTSCLVEIGGALGADYLASGSVGMLGDTMLLNLKVVRPRLARTVATWSEQVDTSDLADAAREAVADLLRQLGSSVAPRANTLTPTTPVATAETEGATPAYKKWWVWTIVGAVVAGAAVGTAVAVSGGSGSGGPATTSFDIQLPDPGTP